MTKQDSKWSIALRGHLAQRPSPVPPEWCQVPRADRLTTVACITIPVTMALWSLFILGA
jgi:hypothetical protein